MSKLLTSLTSEDAIMVPLSYSYDGYSSMFIIVILMRSTLEVSCRDCVFKICFRNLVHRLSRSSHLVFIVYFFRKLSLNVSRSGQRVGVWGFCKCNCTSQC